jgi:hypothetical protein
MAFGSTPSASSGGNQVAAGVVGPGLAAGYPDNTAVNQRFGRSGALVVTEAHGRFHEAASRLKLFFLSNGIAGVASAAAWLSPVAAAAATCLSLWNPSTSGVAFSILQTQLGLASGTVEVGSYVYNFHPVAGPITATANAVTKTLSAGASTGLATTSPSGSGRGYSNTAITAGLVGYEGNPIGDTPAVVGGSITHNADGMDYVPAGSMITIGAPTNGTSAVVYASMVYEEVPPN